MKSLVRSDIRISICTTYVRGITVVEYCVKESEKGKMWFVASETKIKGNKLGVSARGKHTERGRLWKRLRFIKIMWGASLLPIQLPLPYRFCEHSIFQLCDLLLSIIYYSSSIGKLMALCSSSTRSADDLPLAASGGMCGWGLPAHPQPIGYIRVEQKWRCALSSGIDLSAMRLIDRTVSKQRIVVHWLSDMLVRSLLYAYGHECTFWALSFYKKTIQETICPCHNVFVIGIGGIPRFSQPIKRVTIVIVTSAFIDEVKTE